MQIKEQTKPGKIVALLNKKLERRAILTEYPQMISDMMINRLDWYGKKPPRVLGPMIKDEKPMVVRDFRVADKGSYTYFQGFKEPIRNMHAVKDLDSAFIWKRALTYYFQFFNGKQKFEGRRGILQKFLILLSLLVNYKFYRKFIHHAIEDNLYDHPDRYSQSIRELYRVMSEFPLERDILCFFMDTDHAYLYRFQDIMAELNKEALKKNALKEIIRLIDIMISREPFTGERGMRDKMRMAKKVIVPAYWAIRIFKPKLLKRLIKILEDLNIDEVKFSKEDLFWTNRTKSYNFGGLKYETRQLIQ
jgi:hypothetical protein